MQPSNSPGNNFYRAGDLKGKQPIPSGKGLKGTEFPVKGTACAEAWRCESTPPTPGNLWTWGSIHGTYSAARMSHSSAPPSLPPHQPLCLWLFCPVSGSGHLLFPLPEMLLSLCLLDSLTWSLLRCLLPRDAFPATRPFPPPFPQHLPPHR